MNNNLSKHEKRKKIAQLLKAIKTIKDKNSTESKGISKSKELSDALKKLNWPVLKN